MRNEKGSRNRGLPPFVRIQLREAMTGSFPTVSRTSGDHRGGRYHSFFNDSSELRYGFYSYSAFSPLVSNTALGYSSSGVLSWYPMEVAGAITSVTDYGSLGNVLTTAGATGVGYVDPNFRVGAANQESVHIQAYTLGQTYALSKSPVSSLDFSPNSPFSVSIRVNFDSFPQTYNAVMGRDVGFAAFSDWEILVTNTGQIQAAVFRNVNGRHRVAATDTGLISAGTWYHIVVTFDGTANFQFYVNGVLVNSTITFDNGWSFFSSSANGRFSVGKLYDGDYIGLTPGTSNLYVDQLVIYNRVITSAEVSVLYSGFENGVAISTGLPTTSQYISSEIATTLVTGSYVKKGIGDKWITGVNPPGEILRAFDDSGHATMDGMLVANHSASAGTFYKTGSALQDAGPGFQQSLWDKTKIEIDLTPSAQHSFGITNFTSGSNSYSMAYFNRTTKLWSGVGSGKEPITYCGTTLLSTSVGNLLTFFDEKAVGFGGTLAFQTNTLMVSGGYILGNPISNFGFPFHEKYSGSADTTFLMSDYISEPFLLEKVVVYWSGAFDSGNSQIPGGSHYASANTFFILNERNAPNPFGITQNISIVSGTTAVPAVTYLVTSSLSSSKSRDLVTWLQIAVDSNLPEPFSLFSKVFTTGREKVYPSPDGYSGQITMSGTLKSPLQFAQGMSTLLTDVGVAPFNTAGQRGPEYFETWKESGRNNRGDRGRNWKNTFATPQTVGTFPVTSYRGVQTQIVANRAYSLNNPYVLLPTDRLIFGWQVAHLIDTWNYYVGLAAYNGIGPTLSFSANGIHKVVLYGSLLRVGDDGDLKEYHDTLNQHLTSVSIHEVIGS